MALKLIIDPTPPVLPPPSARDFGLLIERAAYWVVNVKTPAPFDVYVGRANPRFKALGWGNEFLITKAMTREEAVGRFWDAVEADGARLARIRRELRGKMLGCFCAPALCHAHVLVWIANDLGILG